MRKFISLVLALSFFPSMLSGCAAVGIPLTSDPDKKLYYAQRLFNEEGRPLPAEPLIEEAITIYTNNNNDVGLARAYQTYAYFLQSSALLRWEKTYRQSGFINNTVTFDNRYQKALDYWQKSLFLYENNAAYGEASNVYYNIGRLYYIAFKNKIMACENYNNSLESHGRYQRLYPYNEVTTPSGFDNFIEYIEALKSEIGCEI